MFSKNFNRFIISVFIVLSIIYTTVGYANPYGVASMNRTPSCAYCHKVMTNIPTPTEKDPYPPSVELKISQDRLDADSEISINCMAFGGKYSLRGVFLMGLVTDDLHDYIKQNNVEPENWQGLSLVDIRTLGWNIIQDSNGTKYNYIEQSVMQSATPIIWKVQSPIIEKNTNYKFVAILVFGESEIIKDIHNNNNAYIIASQPVSITINRAIAPGKVSAPIEFQKKTNNIEQVIRESILIGKGWLLSILAWILFSLSLLLLGLRKYYKEQMKGYNFPIGSDLWWLIYIFFRDVLLILGLVIGLISFLPANISDLNKLINVDLSFAQILMFIGYLLIFSSFIIKLIRNIEKEEFTMYVVLSIMGGGYLIYTIGYFFHSTVSKISFYP